MSYIGGSMSELYKYKAKVLRVVDGDTFDMEVDLGFGLKMQQRFRINDYDAPETWRPKSDAEEAHGNMATARAEELVMGKDITIRSTKVPGIYGRWGADVWLEDGRNYIDVMFQEGLEKLDEY